MPLYEYYCDACNGAFELLRPAREASAAQPCPICDEDAKRIISHQWSAFIYREGYTRRLPDDGGYWHLGKKMDRPMTSSRDLDPPDPPTAPSIEEIERYEAHQEWKAREADPEGLPQTIDDAVREEARLKRKMLQTRGSRAEEAAKRRALTAERELKKKTGE